MSNPTKRTWIFFVALVISYGLLELLNDFLQKRSVPGTLMFLPFLILFLPIDSFLIPFIDGFMAVLHFWDRQQEQRLGVLFAHGNRKNKKMKKASEPSEAFYSYPRRESNSRCQSESLMS